MKKHPVFNPINVPLVINQNGDKLLTNKDRLEARAWFEAAKTETNAPIVIGKPGGKYANEFIFGVWLPEKNKNLDLSEFWRAYRKISKS